jgi:predicted PurR-regulated permease PerM
MLKPISLSRVTQILLFIILLSVLLYFGREIFLITTFAGFLAMLMTPLSNRIEKSGIPRIFSALISILIIVAVFSGIVLLLSGQIISLVQDIPKIISEAEQLIVRKSWISRGLDDAVEQKLDTVVEQSADVVINFIKGTFKFAGSLLVLLVFTFLFLLHREKYENFIVMLHKQEKRNEARELIDKITKISEQYLTGRLFAVILMAIIYITGFLIIGLKNGVVLSLIAALIAFVPYVGSIIGGLIPLFISLVEGPFDQTIGVLIVIVLVNIIGHYYIEPYIVGGSVNISPFFTIFSLVVGGVFWGVGGIILFLPLLGILKITFENVEGLKPYGYLIGDQDDSSVHEKIWLKLKEFFTRKKKK